MPHGCARRTSRCSGSDDGQLFRSVAHTSITADFVEYWERGFPVSRETMTGRATLERKPVQIVDILADPEFRVTAAHRREGIRTVLAVPLLREDTVIGAIATWRREVRPFTDQQIKLLRTFAAQAVIAIENVRLFNETKEALERETATAEILKVISSSPTDIQPVLDAVAERAAHLCNAPYTHVLLIDGDNLQFMSVYSTEGGPKPGRDNPVPIRRTYLNGRAVLDREVVHIADVVPLLDTEFPDARSNQGQFGFRAVLVVPLLREGKPVGTIFLWRREAGLFSDDQVALLKTFADQAVIAIENVRLFKELDARNRELTEALDQQKASAEVLQVISSSVADTRPVFDKILESCQRLFEGRHVWINLVGEDGAVHLGAYKGAGRDDFESIYPLPLSRESGSGSAILDRRVQHYPDIEHGAGVPMHTRRGCRPIGVKSVLIAPMLWEGRGIGAIFVGRATVGVFAEKEIALLKTFADQAVIAIENVRLFKELEARNRELSEALEQQTVTGEILRVISSSPTDLAPVFDAVAKSVSRLCDAPDVVIARAEGESMRFAASVGPFGQTFGPELAVPIVRGSVAGRAVLERRTIQVRDLAAESDDEYPEGKALQRRYGHRTMVAAPLLLGDTALGAIVILRGEVRPFSDKQVALLRTFADQAVIAIENVRLFKELQARTQELTRSVKELRALGNVGQAVSSTLDLQTVLKTIVSQVDQLSGTDGGSIYEYDEPTEELHLRAVWKFDEELIESLGLTRVRIGEGSVGRAAATREPVQISDVLADEAYKGRLREFSIQSGFRAVLAVPLLREDRILGALVVARNTPGTFPPATLELLRTFATQSAVAIQNARLFREIEDKGRQLEVANRHKSEFLANMSHELRTPLNAIIGFSEALKERMFGELNPKQGEYIEDIHSSGKHLLSLINDILDLAKIEAGRIELELAEFYLPAALSNAMTLVRERAARHGVTVECDIDPQLGTFQGDERKFKQILLNLLANAVKFTPEAGTIHVAARRNGAAIELSVADTGIGIAPEDQGIIFEEFRQVGRDYTGKAEGTGLGLALTKRFVELHGGSIRVESAVGRGSTFTVTLPLTNA